MHLLILIALETAMKLVTWKNKSYISVLKLLGFEVNFKYQSENSELQYCSSGLKLSQWSSFYWKDPELPVDLHCFAIYCYSFKKQQWKCDSTEPLSDILVSS